MALWSVRFLDCIIFHNMFISEVSIGYIKVLFAPYALEVFFLCIFSSFITFD